MDPELKSSQKANSLLRERLFGVGVLKDSNESTLVTRQRAFETIQELLQRTILHGEGNSLLISGPRGVGKSWILDKVLHSLEADKRTSRNFLKVQLNGLLHTDDRLALLAIARQLNVEEELQDSITLSFSAALNYLLEVLRSGSQANQSIVFILDEFDLFTHHKNQTLLYNLFDIAQAAHNPIAVIGLTCREDAVELLEKRVKSRFSHRQITLLCDYSFEDYLHVFFELLALPNDFGDHFYSKKWTDHLEELVKDKTVREVLRQVYDYSPTVKTLISLLTLPVCRLGLNHAFLQAPDFVQSLSLIFKDSKSAMLHGVSILELCLIVAMKHICEINGDVPFNFEMVYNEYKKFTQRSHSVEFFSKPVALKAFEHLVSLEFVSPTDSKGITHVSHHSGKVMKEYQPMMLMIGEEQIQKAVRNYPNCPTDVARWGTSTGMA